MIRKKRWSYGSYMEVQLLCLWFDFQAFQSSLFATSDGCHDLKVAYSKYLFQIHYTTTFCPVVWSLWWYRRQAPSHPSYNPLISGLGKCLAIVSGLYIYRFQQVQHHNCTVLYITSVRSIRYELTVRSSDPLTTPPSLQIRTRAYWPVLTEADHCLYVCIDRSYVNSALASTWARCNVRLLK